MGFGIMINVGLYDNNDTTAHYGTWHPDQKNMQKAVTHWSINYKLQLEIAGHIPIPTVQHQRLTPTHM